MREIMEQLIALQDLQFRTASPSAETRAEMEKLRERVPETILAHYDRLVLRGRKGISIARNGVCTECHLRITNGKFARLAHSNEVHRCDNCGRFLFLPEVDGAVFSEATSVPSAAARKGSRKVASSLA